MDELKSYFERDALAAHLGMELIEVSPGRAVARMAIQDYHHNSLGMIHGGAMFALADYVFAAASNSHGTVAVALNASINFVKAPDDGVLTAVGEEVSLSSRIATYHIVVTDSEGDTVATFQGTVYRKKATVESCVVPG